MNLEEKINWEFKCFFLDQMRTSKENIFAHSKEIEMKKKLQTELIALGERVDEAAKSVLQIQNNLLESAYCFLQDMKEQEGSANIKEDIDKWLAFLLAKQKKFI